MKMYILHFVEGIGLCFIGAVSDKSFSEAVMQTFIDQMAQKYGPPTESESHASDKSIIRGEPFISHWWSPRSGFAVHGNVKAIELKGSVHGGVSVGFWFTTFDACKKAIDRQGWEAF